MQSAYQLPSFYLWVKNSFLRENGKVSNVWKFFPSSKLIAEKYVCVSVLYDSSSLAPHVSAHLLTAFVFGSRLHFQGSLCSKQPRMTDTCLPLGQGQICFVCRVRSRMLSCGRIWVGLLAAPL